MVYPVTSVVIGDRFENSETTAFLFLIELWKVTVDTFSAHYLREPSS